VVEVVGLAIMNIVTAAEMMIVIEEGEVVAEVEVVMVVEEQGYNVSSAEVLIMHQRVPITVTSDEYQQQCSHSKYIIYQIRSQFTILQYDLRKQNFGVYLC
jgi:hypothetical protein